MEIQIPSPSVFLRKSPSLPAVSAPPPKKLPKAKAVPKSKPAPKDGSVQKAKQSKSRNGCMTCKKKRLKCDETKPSCVQCQKRSVDCEGYKKDFKWRPFDDDTFNNKYATNRRKPSEGTSVIPTKKLKPQNESVWSLDSAFASASHAFQGAAVPTIVSPTTSLETEPLPLPELDSTWNPPKFDLPSPGSSFDLIATPNNHHPVLSHNSSFSGSPTLDELLIPAPDVDEQPVSSNSDLLPFGPSCPDPPPGSANTVDDQGDVDEEIVRDPTYWGPGSPAPPDTPCSQSSNLTILACPELDLASPEKLVVRFDRSTCGILSVKDGPTENPWRTLIWPLAHNSPALYHAISSMTAFHGASEHPRLRLAGVAHMQKSIKILAADISNMNLESALATSLALALGEGWDERTSTGIQHLRGAKIMVNNALVKYRQNNQRGHTTPEGALRLKFLCNTFVYLDVIARLTSTTEAQDLNFDDMLAIVNPPGGCLEVDPLMGCATTLFPLIGRVANLIQKVRNSTTNSLNVVSQANELQEELMQWTPPSVLDFARPEDPSSEVEHSIRTAEAYRIATLLYLYQAVPELPDNPHEAMAKKVLLYLASVPLSSRTVIVQIFPLFAASCELTMLDDRSWATKRWSSMMARLSIGNVDSCWRVVQEVWRRRDEFEAEKASRLSRTPSVPRRSTMTDSPLSRYEQEYTIRGRLHWIGVMSEWQWEVFLG